jgi:calcineurin-like phosphoesterase family protein
MSSFHKRIKNFFYNAFIGNKILKDNEILDGNRVWFVSDMHFGHRNMIKWCRSDCFKNLKQMHQRMISNWNYVVGNYDRVYCLGDFGDFRYKRHLKGRITLAKGNMIKNNGIDNMF